MEQQRIDELFDRFEQIFLVSILRGTDAVVASNDKRRISYVQVEV